LDANRDGTISQNDFIQRFAAWQLAQKTRPRRAGEHPGLNLAAFGQNSTIGRAGSVGGSIVRAAPSYLGSSIGGGVGGESPGEIMRFFDRLDTMGSGQVATVQVKAASFEMGRSASESQDLMAALDPHGDGVVTRGEFQIRYQAWSRAQSEARHQESTARGLRSAENWQRSVNASAVMPASRAEITKIFRQLDKDGSGDMSLSELKHATWSMGLGEEEAEELMVALDPFGLGSLTESEFQERYFIWHQAREEAQLRSSRRGVAGGGGVVPEPTMLSSDQRGREGGVPPPPRALPVMSRINVARDGGRGDPGSVSTSSVVVGVTADYGDTAGDMSWTYGGTAPSKNAPSDVPWAMSPPPRSPPPPPPRSDSVH